MAGKDATPQSSFDFGQDTLSFDPYLPYDQDTWDVDDYSSYKDRRRVNDYLSAFTPDINESVSMPPPNLENTDLELRADQVSKEDEKCKEIEHVPGPTSRSRRRQTVPCSYCDKELRGQHELTRHVRNQHKDKFAGAQIKVWVVSDRIQEDEAIFKDCAPCRDRRQYKQEYNCAAHLKRGHFQKKIGEPSLPMEEYRKWMTMIEIPATQLAKRESEDDIPNEI
jgi:hypothetical protein